MKERNEASSQNNEFQNHARERERIGVACENHGRCQHPAAAVNASDPSFTMTCHWLLPKSKSPTILYLLLDCYFIHNNSAFFAMMRCKWEEEQRKAIRSHGRSFAMSKFFYGALDSGKDSEITLSQSLTIISLTSQKHKKTTWPTWDHLQLCSSPYFHTLSSHSKHSPWWWRQPQVV